MNPEYIATDWLPLHHIDMSVKHTSCVENLTPSTEIEQKMYEIERQMFAGMLNEADLCNANNSRENRIKYEVGNLVRQGRWSEITGVHRDYLDHWVDRSVLQG